LKLVKEELFGLLRNGMYRAIEARHEAEREMCKSCGR
jgi:hypothetical protein